MYALAREGKIKNFTGIDDPYESPLNPEVVIDTVGQTAEENADRILAYLVEQGFVVPSLNKESESFETEDGARVEAVAVSARS
jgi:hypothetical protein